MLRSVSNVRCTGVALDLTRSKIPKCKEAPSLFSPSPLKPWACLRMIRRDEWREDLQLENIKAAGVLNCPFPNTCYRRPCVYRLTPVELSWKNHFSKEKGSGTRNLCMNSQITCSTEPSGWIFLVGNASSEPWTITTCYATIFLWKTKKYLSSHSLSEIKHLKKWFETEESLNRCIAEAEAPQKNSQL